MLDDPRHAEAAERLRASVVVWLTTVNPGGQPQSTPVWFVVEDGSVLVYSQPGKPKLRNIEANPSVGLNVPGTDTGDDVVILEGRAERDRAAPPADRVPAYVEKYRDHIAGLGWTPESFASDYSEAVRIRPTRLRAW
jgi:PPOX class probable F420-dependent enzyme